MRKSIIIILSILSIFFMVSCSKKDTSTDEVKVLNFTISYEGLDDTLEQEKKDYYLDRNLDFNINIYLDNIEDYEILSITIADKTYKKDDFDEESTNSKVIINENTKDNYGSNILKINEVKVNINGKNKNIILNDNEIILNVKQRYTPNVTFVADSEIPGFTTYGFTLNVTDRGNIIDFAEGDIYLEVYDGDKLVYNQTLLINNNEIELNKLKIDSKYEYKVLSKFDLSDGYGDIQRIMFEGNFKTQTPFNIRVYREEETSFEFEYKNLYDVELKSLKLFKGKNKVRDLDFETKIVEELSKDTTFELVFEYEYVYEGKTVVQKQIVEAKTMTIVWEDVVRNGKVIKHPDGSAVRIPTYKKQEEEVRGIWVSTVDNIDIQEMQGNDIEGYKRQITIILDTVKKAKFNTVFFQIRPMNDAFYPSELAPWSRYITGKEDKDPGFDVLGFALQEAHARGLELHGWLNPYRVSNTENGFNQMSDKNFAKKNQDLLLKGPGTGDAVATILNPGRIEVQTYVRDVIKEIINNYPTIDGIHFDDYFYLTTFGENQMSPDYQTYLDHRLNEEQSIADFRRMSVTNMIKNIHQDVTEFNNENDTKIKFGISPSGVWADKSPTIPDGSETKSYQHYVSLYADTKLWIKEGYIHYIIPQIYWDFNQILAPYGHLIDWWTDVIRGTDVDLVIGMGLYRYAQPTTKWYTLELAQQLRYNQNYKEVKGSTFFTYRDLVRSTGQGKEVLEYIYTNYWTDEAVTPWTLDKQV